MAQSLAKKLIPLVFSTKSREPLIVPAVRTSLHSYLRKKSFQDEFRTFLRKYEIEYDERYVWD